MNQAIVDESNPCRSIKSLQMNQALGELNIFCAVAYGGFTTHQQ
jgi:hypothetical protein